MKDNSENLSSERYSFSESDVTTCFENLIAAIYQAGDLLATLNINNLHTLEVNISENTLEHYEDLLRHSIGEFETAREILLSIDNDQFASASSSLSKEWEIDEGFPCEIEPKPSPKRISIPPKDEEEEYDPFSDF